MKSTTRRIVCWNCKETFHVDIPEIKSAQVVVTRALDKSSRTQTAKQELIVKCPNCGKENRVRV